MVCLMATAAVIAGVCCTAALLICGALGAAALLPRGAPLAEALRTFAGVVSGFVWRAVQLVDGLVFVAALALGAMITLMHT